MRSSRAWHAVLGAVLLAALVVQLAIAIDAPATPAAHAVGTLRGTNVVGRLVRMFSFFTIQSNVLSTVAAIQLAVRPDRDGRFWRVIRLAGLFGITVTGIVYSTVLARIHQPNGWAETSTNIVVHYIAPVGIVVGWLLFGPRPRIDRSATLALAWPALWATWTIVHGAVTQWYPYPFVDVITHGYVRVIANAVAVIVVLAAVTALFAWGDRALAPAPRSECSADQLPLADPA